MSNISDPAFVYHHRTDLATRFREMGFVPPEKRAEEVERESRHDGALRCMRRIQAEDRPHILRRRA